MQQLIGRIDFDLQCSGNVKNAGVVIRPQADGQTLSGAEFEQQRLHAGGLLFDRKQVARVGIA